MALLDLNFRNVAEVAMIMGTLPLAMVGSVWLMYLQGFNFSVAVGVGFIALAGVAVEIGVTVSGVKSLLNSVSAVSRILLLSGCALVNASI